MPILTVRHITTYRYRQPVAFGEHRLMVRPRDSHDQKLLETQLIITPEPTSIRWVHDVFGNCVAIARFGSRADELRFESTIRLNHYPSDFLGVEFSLADYAQTYPFSYDADDMPDLLRSIERNSPDPERLVDAWAWQFLKRDGPTGTREMLAAMTHAIRQGFTYEGRPAGGAQDAPTTLKKRSGSCRDFAVLMMDAVRSLGLAARFVSGYLHTRGPNDGRYVGGGSTHAWIEVYLPGAGWVEFDPTNGIVGNRDLIRVAVVRDPRQAVPLSGTWTGFPSDFLGMDVEVDVTSDEGEEPVLVSAAAG